MSQVGRNAPCPCGSGKKYKNCCFDERRSSGPEPPGVEERDGRLIIRIGDWASRRLGERFAPLREFPYDIVAEPELVALFVPWSVYEHQVGGRRVVDLYLAERRRALSDADRAWLEAQSRSWLSAWGVLEVEPGVGLRVADLLTGERRDVRDVEGSRVLVARDVVLGRVVGASDAAVFSGMHHRLLPAGAAARFVEIARGDLLEGKGEGAVPVARLQEAGVAARLLVIWQGIVRELEARPRPRLTNTDGDDLVVTIDRYAIADGARAEVERRLLALEGAEPVPRSAPGPREIMFLRAGNATQDWDNTVIGRARIEAGAPESRSTLELGTNSVKRADALRARVEEACGDLLRHRAREHPGPRGYLAGGGG
jgi:hypothetical protein